MTLTDRQLQILDALDDVMHRYRAETSIDDEMIVDMIQQRIPDLNRRELAEALDIRARTRMGLSRLDMRLNPRPALTPKET